MRRKALFGIILLLLTLTLLPTASIVAKGPPEKGEDKTVSFAGDFEGSGTMTVDGRGTNLWVYGSIDLTFSDTFPADFVGEQSGGFRITIKGGVDSCEALVYYDFAWYDNVEVDSRVPLYHLEGSGTTSSAVGTYTVNLDASIYDVVPHRKGKKGAIGLEFVGPVWSGSIGFTMTIE